MAGERGPTAAFASPHGEPVSARPFAEHRDTALWRTVAAAVGELEATREITLGTAPDYVIGYLCQQIALRHQVDAATTATDGR